ncbi:MAG: MotA/TolQ/ExbB proton channel family protein [Myxococcota bacterium]
MNTSTLLESFDAAWVLWLLVALSVASIALSVERALFFFRNRLPRNVDSDFQTLIKAAEFTRAARLMDGSPSLEAQVVVQGLAQAHKGWDSVEESLRGAEVEQRARFSGGLAWLATIGSNAPFIGLFGTVLGIMEAFAALSEGGGQAAGPSVMAAISEALEATAVGLFVAIPALVAFNYFQGLLENRVARAQVFAQRFLSELKADVSPSTQEVG